MEPVAWSGGVLAAQGARIAATSVQALKGDLALSILADDAACLCVFEETTLAGAAPALVHACMAGAQLPSRNTHG